MVMPVIFDISVKDKRALSFALISLPKGQKKR